MSTYNCNAKVLYVDPNGNDNSSYLNNDINNPWQTIGRAVWGSTIRNIPNSTEAAQAGDTVIVNAGTYTTTQVSGLRYFPSYNPVNNGTNGNPITLQANGIVILESNSGGDDGVLIGAYQKSHIIWDGFIINEANIETVSDTGPVVIWSSDNITIQNITIFGVMSSWNDNHNGIRVEESSDSILRNNRISGIRNAGLNGNGSAITVYRSSNITFENNEIDDSGSGIYLKGENPGPFTVRYNLFHHIDGAAITVGQIGNAIAPYGATIYQNIIRDSYQGIIFVSISDYPYGPANIKVVNNTIENCSNSGIFISPHTAGFDDIAIQNNIIANSSHGIQAEDLTQTEHLTSLNNDFSFSYNLYFNINTVGRVNYTDYTSLTNWQNTFGKDITGSSTSDPQFINANNDNFRLEASSPANLAGIDILNLQNNGINANINIGAYVTGAETIGADLLTISPPSAPGNIVISKQN